MKLYNLLMITVLTEPIEKETLPKLAKTIGGFYIKIVIDLEKQIMAAGAKMHVDEEQLLISEGSEKEDLWGGGYDLETGEISYDSIINNKPGINSSSDMLDPKERVNFEKITRRLLNL